MKKIVLIFLTICASVFNIHAQNEINGHEYVDLGLSVNWATCNVGADTPEDYGDYYSWGEISTKTKYTFENSLTVGKNINDIRMNSKYDVAQTKWGDRWRMPTKEEMIELVNKCNWTWTTLTDKSGNKVNGYKITGPNGNSIFLPACGLYKGQSYSKRDGGFYWSSTPLEGSNYDSYYLKFSSNSYEMYEGFRHHGYQVRPVSSSSRIKIHIREYDKINGHEYVDLGLPSGTKWATCNVGASNSGECGEYYSWGEITTSNCYSKTNTKLYHEDPGDISGNRNFDVARAKWGGTWRMPTKAEMEELIEKCTWQCFYPNCIERYYNVEGFQGVWGYNVIGPNGNSIFLIAGGRFENKSYICGGSNRSGYCGSGYYWTSTPSYDYNTAAYYLSFYGLSDYDLNSRKSANNGVEWHLIDRSKGLLVRPVSD